MSPRSFWEYLLILLRLVQALVNENVDEEIEDVQILTGEDETGDVSTYGPCRSLRWRKTIPAPSTRTGRSGMSTTFLRTLTQHRPLQCRSSGCWATSRSARPHSNTQGWCCLDKTTLRSSGCSCAAGVDHRANHTVYAPTEDARSALFRQLPEAAPERMTVPCLASAA